MNQLTPTDKSYSGNDEPVRIVPGINGANIGQTALTDLNMPPPSPGEPAKSEQIEKTPPYYKGDINAGGNGLKVTETFSRAAKTVISAMVTDADREMFKRHDLRIHVAASVDALRDELNNSNIPEGTSGWTRYKGEIGGKKSEIIIDIYLVQPPHGITDYSDYIARTARTLAHELTHAWMIDRKYAGDGNSYKDLFADGSSVMTEYFKAVKKIKTKDRDRLKSPFMTPMIGEPSTEGNWNDWAERAEEVFCNLAAIERMKRAGISLFPIREGELNVVSDVFNGMGKSVASFLNATIEKENTG